MVRASVSLENQASVRGSILLLVWGSDVPRKALEGLGLGGSVGLLKALPRTLVVHFQWSGIGWPGSAARRAIHTLCPSKRLRKSENARDSPGG